MVTQTIEIESEYPDEANTTCDARDKVTRAFVQSSAVLTAPDASGVIYLPQFTDLPAGEYLFILKDSSGEKLTYGYATVALQTATYKLSGVPQASQPALATAVASLDTKLGEPALDSIAEDIAAVKTDTGNLVARITDTLFDGITSLAAWLGALAGKTEDTATRAEINATTAGVGYNETTDSQEALRDQGDAAWTTGAGGGGGSTTISDEDIQEIVAGVTAVAPRICDSSAGTFRMTAGDTWVQDFTVTTTGADKFIVAVKNKAADADSAAVLLIDSVDGLERVNGSVPDDAADASITTGAATITATVESNITLMIVPGKYTVTVKKLDVGSDVTPISTASLTVFAPGVSEIST